jgi:hypothetical protein
VKKCNPPIFLRQDCQLPGVRWDFDAISNSCTPDISRENANSSFCPNKDIIQIEKSELTQGIADRNLDPVQPRIPRPSRCCFSTILRVVHCEHAGYVDVVSRAYPVSFSIPGDTAPQQNCGAGGWDRITRSPELLAVRFGQEFQKFLRGDVTIARFPPCPEQVSFV